MMKNNVGAMDQVFELLKLQWTTTVSNLTGSICGFIFNACAISILVYITVYAPILVHITLYAPILVHIIVYAPILVHITLSHVQSHDQISSAHACSYAPILVHM